MRTSNPWPELHFSHLQPTLETLHQYLQIVGKIRLKTMPWQNHSWHATLYVSPQGFTTQGIPYQERNFELSFNFKQHQLLIHCSDTEATSIALGPRTVASFYAELFSKLKELGIEVSIYAKPNEVEPAIPFAENTTNKHYEPEAAVAIWQAMLRVNGVFHKFRSNFIGKVSPVHLFWGAFDLAVTRFSGKKAPLHPGGIPNMPLNVMQEAYSHEVSSAGFWPGSKDSPEPVFYAYAYPTPKQFGEQVVRPKEAFYSSEMQEYFLKYSDVQAADHPEHVLREFLQSTYEAAARTLNWPRAKLERG